MATINLGSEDEVTEFKKDLAQLDKGIIALTAMVNRRGKGTVYFGVDDDGDVVGVKPGPDYLEKVRNRIRTYVSPQLLAEITLLETPDGLDYIRVSAIGTDIPYSFDGRYYVRNVSSNEQASPSIVRKMMMCGNTDIMAGVRSPAQDLTFTSYMTFLEANNLHPKSTKDYFDGMGMLTESKEYNLVAYLMSDQNMITMQVVRFDGKTKASMSKRTDYGHRCILMAVRSVLDNVEAINETNVDLSTGTRVETDLFNVEAFRESWINACVHNSWKDMLPPSVFIFDDRIEVQSYGGIPFTLSMDEFYSGKSSPVNKALFNIFSLVDYTEQSGHGVTTIVEHYGKESITLGEYMVTVTIPFAFHPAWVVSRQTSAVSNVLDEVESEALNYLELHPNASMNELSTQLGVGRTKCVKIISNLKTKGLLVNDGNTRRNEWKVLR